MGRNKRGLVISFSGPDGSGKSTQIELLRGELQRRGLDPVVLWTRLGYTPGFERSKALLRKVFSRSLPPQGDVEGRERVMRKGFVGNLWLAAATADFLFTMAGIVRYHTMRGRPVICDRHVWDALIDRRMNFPNAGWVDPLVESGTRLLGGLPDVALLLSLPLAEAKRRSEAKDEPFPDSAERRATRHFAYESLDEESVFHLVDATRTPEEIAREITKLLDR